MSDPGFWKEVTSAVTKIVEVFTKPLGIGRRPTQVKRPVLQLRGRIVAGCGHAGRNWGISEIQKVTGYANLKQGTLNVRLEAEHNLRPYCKLPREDRKDGIGEDLYFEHCCLVIGTHRVPALIARTSTNYWGSSVLEIMAEVMLKDSYRLRDGDVLDVEVCVENSAGEVSNSPTS